MNHLYRGPGHEKAGPDLHHASRVPRGHNLGTRFQNRPNLVPAYPAAQLRVGDAVGSRPPATILMARQGYPLQGRYGIENDQWFRGDALGMKKVAGRVIRHSNWERPALQKTGLSKQFAYVPDPGRDFSGSFPEVLVFRQKMRVLLH